MLWAAAVTSAVLLAGNPNEWNSYDQKTGKGAKAAKAPAEAKAAPAAAAAPATGGGVPAAGQPKYKDAVQKIAAKQYGPANDLLNALAAEYPQVPEIFASRCSAQLGLQHWAAAEADCAYSLNFKQLPTAIYGLAVAEDGQAKYGQAIAHYRQFAALPDAAPALKTQATDRADLLAKAANPAAPAAAPAGEREEAVAPAPPPPPVAAKGSFQPGIPDPNEGLLYVYRNMLMGIGTSSTVYVDDKRVGELTNDRYWEIKLRPGKHTITIKARVNDPAKAEPMHQLPLEIAEGDVHYMKLEYWPKNDDVGFKLVAVGKEGRKEIREDCAQAGSKKM